MVVATSWGRLRDVPWGASLEGWLLDQGPFRSCRYQHGKFLERRNNGALDSGIKESIPNNREDEFEKGVGEYFTILPQGKGRS